MELNNIFDELLDSLKVECEKAASESYHDGYDEGDYIHFKGCSVSVDWIDDMNIDIEVDENGCHEVCIWHKSRNETPLVEKFIADWLDENVDEQAEWQYEYDHDDWRDVDPGCDPAFPHYGDFERWAYGY